MKRKVCMLVGVACTSVVLLGGCSGVRQEDFDALNSRYESVNSQYESVKTDLSTAESNLVSLQSDLSKEQENNESLSTALSEVENDYAAYKESMGEYEGLAAAEVEARRIEAESIAQAEAESKAAAESESLAAAEAEAKAGYETGITYNQLARTPDDYTGKLVKFSGKVVQVIDGTDEIQIRLAVNSNYDTILYCGYDPSIVSSRILEDDIITIYGTSAGLISYQSTMGGTITIPAIYIDKIDQ